MIQKIEQALLKILKMDFNGCLITVDAEIPLYLSESNRQESLNDIIFKLVTPKLEKTFQEMKVIGYNSRMFKEYSAMQTLWVVLLNEERYLIEILFKWYCDNMLVAEINVITITQQEIQNYAIRGLLDHICRFNYSKIVCDMDMIKIPKTTRSVPSLVSNKITDIQKLIDQTGGLMENLDKI